MSTYICVSSYISIYMCVYMLISLTEKFTHLTGCGGNPGHVLKRFPSLMCPFWHMKVHASCTEVMGTGQEFQEEPDEGQQPAPPWFTLAYLGLPWFTTLPWGPYWVVCCCPPCCASLPSTLWSWWNRVTKTLWHLSLVPCPIEFLGITQSSCWGPI